ncbi:MAG: 30S ribosomal protein S17 [Planctomycetes bacterium]|nr:30S ribosomal protein S17 [Planctomycetota bacterium]
MAVSIKKKIAVKQAGGLSGTRQGVVESDGRPQTRRVVVSFLTQHPKYGKYVRQRSILQVHDEKNASRMGDLVEIAPCRPLSRSKRWTLVRVVESRADQAAALKDAKTIQG